MVRVSRVPRYYFADQLVPIRNAAEFASRLASGRWSPAVAFVSQPLTALGPGRVLAVRETANRIEIEAEAAQTAFLVASVTRDRYWRAFIDGRPARLVTTNIAFQGLEMPAGRHHVVLRYRNPIIAILFWPSALTALLALTVAAHPSSADKNLPGFPPFC
jgi:hypothetical protein